MRSKVLVTFTTLAALVVIGAGCSTSTTLTTNNTNISATVNTNISINTNTSGTFSTGTNTSTTTENATVTVSSNGVSPATLTVQSGTAVTFNNTDSRSRQIASDPHPSHTDLPGFDKIIPAGGSFSFTFTRTGTWGYHDHLDANNSKFDGRIIVQ